MHEGAILIIYGNTLTAPKPIFGIDFEKEPLTLDGFEIKRSGFERREEEVEKILMDFAPYSNNNVVVMMMRMNHLLGMTLGKTVKKPIIQNLMILATTPPFGLGYKPSYDDYGPSQSKGTSLSPETPNALYSNIERKVCQNWR